MTLGINGPNGTAATPQARLQNLVYTPDAPAAKDACGPHLPGDASGVSASNPFQRMQEQLDLEQLCIPDKGPEWQQVNNTNGGTGGSTGGGRGGRV
jgi:hypothetical protein